MPLGQLWGIFTHWDSGWTWGPARAYWSWPMSGGRAEDAILKAVALSSRVIADRLEHGEDIPNLTASLRSTN